MGSADHRYLLDDFLADVRTVYIVATVFENATHVPGRRTGRAAIAGPKPSSSRHRSNEPSGLYGQRASPAGIVGFADLTLGDRVEPGAGSAYSGRCGRFRGVRHSEPAGTPAKAIGNSRTATGPHVRGKRTFRAGLARLTEFGLS